MLCQICSEAIKTAAFNLQKLLENPEQMRIKSAVDIVAFYRSVQVPLHEKTEYLHGSILTGCLFCRNLWAWYLHKHLGLQDDSKLFLPSLEKIESIWGHRYRPEIKLTLARRQNSILVIISESVEFEVLIEGPVEDPDKYYSATYLMSKTHLNSPMEQAKIHRHTRFQSNEWRTSTQDSICIWQQWYKTCKETHPGCRVSNSRDIFRPKRLIQVHEEEPFVWNLVDDTPRIIEPYATLSHCWGSSQPKRLTKKDVAKFKEMNLIAELPKTFRDAIEVAKSLEIYYIWIDSLCIIQDDADDWREQSSLMGSIYTHAECNVAASWSPGSSGGCFTTSDPALKHPTFIDLGRQLDGCSTYELLDVDSFGKDVTNAPLNSRAWVCQERYLALRQLSFTTN